MQDIACNDTGEQDDDLGGNQQRRRDLDQQAQRALDRIQERTVARGRPAGCISPLGMRHAGPLRAWILF